MSQTLEKRWSDALLSLARDKGSVRACRDAVEALSASFKGDPALGRYLMNYFAPEEDRLKVAGELAAPYGLEYLANFLKLLVRRHLIVAFRGIARQFIGDANMELGVMSGYVYSAAPLSEERLRSLEDVLGKRIGRKVELVPRLDPRLIAGLRVSLGGKVYDGSLKGRLDSLRRELLAEREAA